MTPTPNEKMKEHKRPNCEVGIDPFRDGSDCTCPDTPNPEEWIEDYATFSDELGDDFVEYHDVVREFIVDLLTSERTRINNEWVEKIKGMKGWDTCLIHDTVAPDCVDCVERFTINRTVSDLLEDKKDK